MAMVEDSDQAARTVGISELQLKASEIVREVHATGRSVDITVRGQVVARLTSASTVTASDAETRRRAQRAWLAETEAFAQDVARRWPSSTSSIDLIHELRREL